MADLSAIQHVVVVMLENRSFDNMLGWLYADGTPPRVFLPPINTSPFNGLNSSLWNPANESYFSGQPAQKVPIAASAPTMTTPDVDPEEHFDFVTAQIYGPDELPSPTPAYPMLGFVVDYEQAVGIGVQADQIMQPFSTAQLPVLSALAQNYAVSDAWFSSVPSQTWPNRCFVHAGTSNGNVNNGDPPNPFDWDVTSIFNVLEHRGVSWKVYSDTDLVPSLTRAMFPKLWSLLLELHFKGFDDFQADCAAGSLPAYSFLEPSFLDQPNDQHPPHDVTAGEVFLQALWEAVSNSKSWNETLLIITYDEHGGTYDHVLPPWGAACPDPNSNPGMQGFTFNRFGVRVPMVVVSPYIAAGTVFRTNTSVPYDHTSILATLRDWLNIPASDMLSSARIAQAPTLAQLLTLNSPRSDKPTISASAPNVRALQAGLTTPTDDQPLNDLQASLVSATAVRQKKNPAVTLARVRTRADAKAFFAQQGFPHR